MKFVYEIVVSPKGGSTGQSVAKVFQCLGLATRFPVAVVADVECNDNRAWAQKPPFLTTTQEVVEYAILVGQFDWATFFLFCQAPEQAPETRNFADLFAQAECVVRAVDDTSIYVYSSAADDTRSLGQQFPIQFYRKSLDSIQHPF
jgi:hypothetical protein